MASPLPGPYSGASTLALVARASAFTFGLVYGNLKLKVLKEATVAMRLSRVVEANSWKPTWMGAVAGEVIECGRGDKKTKKGKRFKGSYGNVRPKNEKMIEKIKDKVEVPRSTPWPLPFKLI